MSYKKKELFELYNKIYSSVCLENKTPKNNKLLFKSKNNLKQVLSTNSDYLDNKSNNNISKENDIKEIINKFGNYLNSEAEKDINIIKLENSSKYNSNLTNNKDNNSSNNKVIYDNKTDCKSLYSLTTSNTSYNSDAVISNNTNFNNGSLSNFEINNINVNFNNELNGKYINKNEYNSSKNLQSILETKIEKISKEKEIFNSKFDKLTMHNTNFDRINEYVELMEVIKANILINIKIIIIFNI